MSALTVETIHKHTQRIAQLELKLAKHKAKARRLDTRNKILLGGLVIKAKLDVLSFPVLLGGLLDIESQLCTEPELLEVFQAKGEAVFLGYQSVEKIALEFISLDAVDAVTAEEKLAALRKETRRKIQLGGLIIKAKLSVLTKAQLLGALVTLNEALRREPALK